MHDAADNLFQILYVSQLRPESGVEVVKDIVAVSRRTNPARGITGALLFDGEHFGQLLEGPEPDVTALMQRIETDPRHHQVTLLFSGPADAARDGEPRGRQPDRGPRRRPEQGPAADAAEPGGAWLTAL